MFKKIKDELDLSTKELNDIELHPISDEHSIIMDSSFKLAPPVFNDIATIDDMKHWLRFTLRHYEKDRKTLLILRRRHLVQSIIFYVVCAGVSGWLALWPLLKWLVKSAQ
jgi:hypothetical protein